MNNKNIVISILVISLLVNATLIMAVTGVMPFLLFCSVVLNMGLLWSIKNIFQTTSEMNNDIESLFSKMEKFTEHTEGIYEMEMYYGDDTLNGLMQHSRELLDEFENYKIRYVLEEEEYEAMLVESEQEEEDEEHT